LTGPADYDQQRHARRPVASRALDRVATLCPACHRGVPAVDGVVLTALVACAGWFIPQRQRPGRRSTRRPARHPRRGTSYGRGTTGRPVLAADLAHPQATATWPRFAAWALAGDIRAVFAFPVLVGTHPVAVLSVYRATAGPLCADDHSRVSRYAHTAAGLLRVVAHIDGAGLVRIPLPDSAVEVQQAVGVVMQYATVDAATALHWLRAYAHHSRRSLRE
jgi:hypothetical protein